MPTLQFDFVVNHSFLRYPGHPITVPRGEVDYKLLEAERLHQGEFIVVFPKGERLTAKMYDGVSSRGPYYQLRFTGRNRAVPSYVQSGNRAHVLLARLGGTNHAIIEEAAP